jgi:PAS domain S-box-containing protein
VPHSFTDLAGLNVSAEDFLSAVLGAAGQPIWVVDRDDVIRFANPAALAALGYEDVGGLVGLRSHEAIHYRRADGAPYPADDCPMRLTRTTGETVARELDWFFRRDGSMFPVSYVSVPLDMPEGRGAVVAFSDIEDRLRAEREVRERDEILAEQQASLRRVATLVVGGAASTEVFAAVAKEVAQLLGMTMVQIWRYEPDGTGTVVGAWGELAHPFQAGTNWPFDDATIAALVEQSKAGRAVKIDDFAQLAGTIAEAANEIGIRSAAGAPIVIDGELWGMIGVGTVDPGPVPDRIERRLVELTELVATAISSSASREELARLANEQAALRRVATLVARESPPAEVFAAVAEELGGLLDAAATRLVRYERDETATIVSSWGRLADAVPVGTRMPLGGINAISLIARTGRPARIDDYAEATGAIGEYGRRLDARGAVGAPVLVAGELWGAMVVSSRQNEPLPAGTEGWIEEFAELIATAIANVQARSDLAASRARIVAAADEERRRVVRDLHDGAQQRLVHTVITLKLARRALEKDEESGATLVGEAVDHAQTPSPNCANSRTASCRRCSSGVGSEPEWTRWRRAPPCRSRPTCPQRDFLRPSRRPRTSSSPRLLRMSQSTLGHSGPR